MVFISEVKTVLRRMRDSYFIHSIMYYAIRKMLFWSLEIDNTQLKKFIVWMRDQNIDRKTNCHNQCCETVGGISYIVQTFKEATLTFIL